MTPAHSFPIINFSLDKQHHPIIYTAGHSTRQLEEFMALLDSFQVTLLVDVRRFPGSKKYPQFNKDALKKTMQQNGKQYQHLVDLGGRRKAANDSKNTVWRHPSFRGYADYMETSVFTKAYQQLIKMATEQTTAIMCSEAVWWRCHRSMIADQLKADGWTVLHIMGTAVVKEHPYTAPAKIIQGKLRYH